MSVFLFVPLLFSCFCSAANDDNVAVIRSCDDFEITGDGSDTTWNKTSWIYLTQRTDKPDTYVTRVKALYSGSGIYFLFECEDSLLTSTIKADFMDLWEEDVVEVFLWTGEDFPVYFEYEISPSDYELPIMVPNHEGKFFGWLPWHYEGDRKTRHATRSSAEGWKAEFFIPFKLLTPLPQVPPVPGTEWRVNMYRIDYDQGHTLFSWQETQKTFHEYHRFGTFVFE